MIDLSHFEKNAGPIVSSIKRLIESSFGPSERFVTKGQASSIIRNNSMEKLDDEKIMMNKSFKSRGKSPSSS